MRPVIETIDGRELEITLTLGQLDEIAKTNPQFEELAVAFQAGVWDWREVVAILSAALRPHGVQLSELVDEIGPSGAKAMASRIWLAAMDVKPAAAPGNAEAVAEATGGTDGSTSPDSSAAA